MIACSKPGEVDTGQNFDRKAMLQQYADNLIRPAYADLQAKVNVLNTAAATFSGSPTAANLTALQTAWTEAYTAWQFANAYNFGPAGEEGVRKGLIEEVGTFPTSTAKVEATITTNNANFNDFNRDARGLPAVEYLIFSPQGNNTQIVTSFQSASRRNFLTAATADIKKRVDEVVTGWSTYSGNFVNRNGTDAGSATSELYNEFIRSYEAIKNFKIALPLGKRPGQTAAEPTRAEGYYSSQSLTFIKAHLTAIENIWYGRARDGKDGVGFKEYLENVEGGQALVASAEAQLGNVRKALNALPENVPLSQQIQTNPAAVENVLNEFQKLTRFFKSDMSSLLGIAITFASGDGD
ncbi:imelysin family protein [Nibrella saemangeumensis]